MTRLIEFLLQFGAAKSEENVKQLLENKQIYVLPKESAPYLLNEISIEKLKKSDRVFITKHHSYVIGADRMKIIEQETQDA